MKTLYACAAVFASVFLLLAAPLYAQEDEQQTEEKRATIIDVARNAGTFSTLLKALDAADLTTTLEGEGPFTLFAPTDEAFAKLPEGAVEDLLKPENKEKLVALLTYHVVEGQATPSADVASAKTLEGHDVTIAMTDSTVMVNEAAVVEPDVEASNGIVHVIDTVLMPPKDANDDR